MFRIQLVDFHLWGEKMHSTWFRQGILNTIGEEESSLKPYKSERSKFISTYCLLQSVFMMTDRWISNGVIIATDRWGYLFLTSIAMFTTRVASWSHDLTLKTIHNMWVKQWGERVKLWNGIEAFSGSVSSKMLCFFVCSFGPNRTEKSLLCVCVLKIYFHLRICSYLFNLLYT